MAERHRRKSIAARRRMRKMLLRDASNILPPALPDRRVIVTAYHEAGHTYEAYRKGAFERVRIDLLGNGRTYCGARSLVDDIRLSLFGLAAEQIFSGYFDDDNLYGDILDIARWRVSAERLRSIWRQVLRETLKNWDFIRNIAVGLLVVAELSKEDVDVIVNNMRREKMTKLKPQPQIGRVEPLPGGLDARGLPAGAAVGKATHLANAPRVPRRR